MGQTMFTEEEVDAEPTKLTADVLIGKSVADAKRFIKDNDVFWSIASGAAITEIHVSRKDGESQSGIKDIRNSEGRMRLNVAVRAGKIVALESIG